MTIHKSRSTRCAQCLGPNRDQAKRSLDLLSPVGRRQVEALLFEEQAHFQHAFAGTWDRKRPDKIVSPLIGDRIHSFVFAVLLQIRERDALFLGVGLSLIHISEPTRRTPISYAVFC